VTDDNKHTSLLNKGSFMIQALVPCWYYGAICWMYWGCIFSRVQPFYERVV